ncbi:MAG: hypothetical protein RJA76_2043 [Bacteroidota bacterium]|jgi:hypothetical protein
MKNILCCILLLSACVNPTRNIESRSAIQAKKVREIDSLRYSKMNDKLAQLDYFDTTDQNAFTNTHLIDDFYSFLTSEVNTYNSYKLFYNQMTSARDTVFILNKGQNFYRYIKKDSKTKLVFDAYMENIQSLPKKLKYNILNLSKDRSKPLVINDSTFSISLLVQFKKDTIDRLIFVYYLD